MITKHSKRTHCFKYLGGTLAIEIPLEKQKKIQRFLFSQFGYLITTPADIFP